MLLRSFSRVLHLTLVVFLLVPALVHAKTDPCADQLLESRGYVKGDAFFDLRRDLVALEKTRLQKPSMERLSALAAELSFSEIVELAETRPGQGEAQSALRTLILQHPADLYERRTVIRKLASDWEKLFRVERYFDEIIGIPREEVEITEDREANFLMDEVVTLGLRAEHDFWFTTPSRLVLLIDEIEKRGAKHVVDLGCGTGRLGILLGFLAPDVQFTGLELYGPRVAAAQAAADRWGFSSHIRFVEQDLLDRDRPIPDADFYYIYGPTNDMSINSRVLARLQKKAAGRAFTVASNHHLMTGFLAKQEWLRPGSANVPLNRTSMWYFDSN